MENNETRITRLEEQYKNLDEKIDKIIGNDLPHIQARLSSIENRLAIWAGAIIVFGWIGQFLLMKL